ESREARERDLAAQRAELRARVAGRVLEQLSRRLPFHGASLSAPGLVAHRGRRGSLLARGRAGVVLGPELSVAADADRTPVAVDHVPVVAGAVVPALVRFLGRGVARADVLADRAVRDAGLAGTVGGLAVLGDGRVVVEVAELGHLDRV